MYFCVIHSVNQREITHPISIRLAEQRMPKQKQYSFLDHPTINTYTNIFQQPLDSSNWRLLESEPFYLHTGWDIYTPSCTWTKDKALPPELSMFPLLICLTSLLSYSSPAFVVEVLIRWIWDSTFFVFFWSSSNTWIFSPH